uniref:Integrase core domain containing protein n=1 Tax=Solanum tuberosum TaxID=4113 RepID=M1DK09_SOLTU
MPNTRSKGVPLVPYDPELRKTIHKMVNAQDLEAQRQRFGLEAKTVARGIQPNVVNNQPRAVDENIAVDGIIPPHRQPIAPRGRAQLPAHMMYEKDDLYLDGDGATGAIRARAGGSSEPSREAPPPPAFAYQAPCTYFTIPMIFLKKLVTDQRQTRTLFDQIVNWMPHLIQRDVLAAKKEIKDEIQKELAVLKDRMDGLKNLVKERFQAAGSIDTEEFKSQLAEMRTQVAKLAEKPVQVPTLIMPDSLMQLLNQAPSTQSLHNFWGELPKSKFGKRKHRARESGEKIHVDLSIEERRQENKARKASRKAVREKEAREQQQRDVVLAGASGSGVPVPASGSQSDHVLISESASVDKGANADMTTGA